MNLSINNEEVLYEDTSAFCHHCLKWVDASLIYETKKGILLRKSCPEHGVSEVVLSRHPHYFFGLRKFYFSLNPKIIPQSRYLLYLTPQCNLSCPICFLEPHSNGKKEIELKDLYLLAHPKRELILFGAEPTCREDLPEIIKFLKDRQSSVSLYTNGMLLSETQCSAILEKNKVDKIYFQFDGFNDDVYNIFRGKKLLEHKLNALRVLKNLNIPVVLDVTVVKGLNLNETGKIFNYALENNFVKAINFIAYVRSGGGREYLADSFIMPDEIIDYIVEYTKSKISRESIFLFQKLLYTYMSLIKRRTCFYIQYFWVYRRKSSAYIPMDKIINLKALEKMLDNYLQIRLSKGKIWAYIYLICSIPSSIFFIKNIPIFFEWLVMIFLHMFNKGEYARRKSNFLQLIFATACDPYKADLKIAQRCHVGIIFKNNLNKIAINEENSFYLLSQETIKKV